MRYSQFYFEYMIRNRHATVTFPLAQGGLRFEYIYLLHHKRGFFPIAHYPLPAHVSIADTSDMGL